MDFAESVRCWLEADEENIIVVHCKGNTTISLETKSCRISQSKSIVKYDRT